LAVVCLNGSVGHEDQCGPGVGDTGVAAEGVGGGANFVGGGWVFPETIRRVDGCVFNGAGVFGRVRVTEIIFTVGVEREVGGEEGGVEGGLGVVEEG